MEQISVGNLSAHAFEFQQLKLHFYKFTKSFLKLNALIGKDLWDLFFTTPNLYQHISPGKREVLIRTPIITRRI
jgi:hypothetical protein